MYINLLTIFIIKKFIGNNNKHLIITKYKHFLYKFF